MHKIESIVSFVKLHDLIFIKKINSKNYEKAIEYYSQIILLLDNQSELRADLFYRRGGSHERLGDYKKADEDLLNSLNINPDDAYVLNYLAYSWLERDYKIDHVVDCVDAGTSGSSVFFAECRAAAGLIVACAVRQKQRHHAG